MMALRIAVNILLAVLLLVAAGALLMTDAYLVRDMVFEGAALWLLALSLGLWAAFAAVIAHSLGRGMLAPPPNSTFKWDPIYVDPTYQGALLVRYGYLVVPAILCLVLACVLAS